MATLLLDSLNNRANHPILDTDAAWRQYILDHRDVVKADATITIPTKEMLARCAYNVPRYLRSQKVDPVYTWIFYLINGLDSDQDFSVDFPASVIYIPNQIKINEMYSTYRTVSQENN